MQTADDIDAMRLLRALARSHPLAVDLTFQAWELGFSEERMKHAVGALRIVGAIDLQPYAGHTLSGRAGLTGRGVDLARSLRVPMPPAGGERRLRGEDRRGPTQTPPAGMVERRGPVRDRRAH
jgi:hypothetical protein